MNYCVVRKPKCNRSHVTDTKVESFQDFPHLLIPCADCADLREGVERTGKLVKDLGSWNSTACGMAGSEQER